MFDSIGANPRQAVYEDEYKKKLEEYQQAKHRRYRTDDWATFFWHPRFPDWFVLS
jgi:hypothetical protein